MKRQRYLPFFAGYLRNRYFNKATATGCFGLSLELVVTEAVCFQAVLFAIFRLAQGRLLPLANMLPV
ncbi:hypothetical protein BAE46_12435 [Glaciecola punicea]|nr:hypothetical protein BAE46_12435 [Glaciecola punicea]